MFKGKRLNYAGGLALIAVFIVLRAWDPVPVQVLRLKTFDVYQSLHPRTYTRQPVTIVDLDEAALAAYGQWPWPRTLVAELVTNIVAAGGAVIGFDVVFAEADRTSPARIADDLVGISDEMRAELAKLPSNDAVLADVIRRTRTVLGQSTTAQPVEDASRGAAIKTTVAVRGLDGVTGAHVVNRVFAFPGLVRNLPMLEEAANALGLFTLRPEIDGIVRRVPMVARVDDELYPSLGVSMLRLAVGGDRVLLEGNRAGVVRVKLTRDLMIPTDAQGRTWVNYTRHDRGRYVSAKDVLDGTLPPGHLRGHFVLVGTSAVGLLDIKATPVEDAMPGVEVHAQLLETMLLDMTRQQLRNAIADIAALPEAQRGSEEVQATLAKLQDQLAANLETGPTYLFRPNFANAVELAVVAAMCALIAVMVTSVGAVWSFFAGGAVVAAMVAGSWYVYVEHGMLIDVAYTAIAGFIIYSFLTYLNYIREEAERRQVREQFEHYMSPALVEELAKHPEKLHLGGEMRDMTLLFCDIRGFTSISELYKSDPEGLTHLINRFLTPMTDVILARRGTIDKYMGDCIMAFWNAPLDDENHASNACVAALEMMKGVRELNEALRAEAEAEGRRYVPINIGIGLNSGECCVGNMGSMQRFDYSVLGDDVNLASRLEGQSKTYGVGIVIGENTYRRAADFAVIELDLIRVKGKDEAVRVFGLLGGPEVNGDPDFARLIEHHGHMLAAYRAQRWAEARELISECRTMNRGLDGLYDLYDVRLDEYEHTPPPPDWDGVYVATTK